VGGGVHHAGAEGHLFGDVGVGAVRIKAGDWFCVGVHFSFNFGRGRRCSGGIGRAGGGNGTWFVDLVVSREGRVFLDCGLNSTIYRPVRVYVCIL